jgi:DNA topoisomerase-3
MTLPIEEEEVDFGALLHEFEAYVGHVGMETDRSSAAGVQAAGRPGRGGGVPALETLLREGFGFSGFRPYQEAVCRAATAGKDVLLVMPTGAGKSLCYQLPGLARGGTTLVVSPLIALIEDQTHKLKAHGFATERIHSGRERAASRAACRAYLDGELDFLFVAPERLKVPGFPEMLARRPLALVAIDEAHCISQWGHDFRPEYRMLGERLPLLRPAPFVALTATATPTVQDDIVSQLRLEEASRFIHGFRRTNIAVEVVERNPASRAEAVRALLSDASRVPAIVYAPSRAETETLAGELSSRLRSTPYHAGMTSVARERAQRAFLEGKVDVVVATIAFGMGIDKANIRTVIHTALPGSIESYYQEIGRAGRDGAPSRAVLFHSFVDTKTHEFFHEKNYPDLKVLQRIYDRLRDEPCDKEWLAAVAEMNLEVFERALEKLWLHGGARVDADESIRRGDPDFAESYARQVEFRLEQIAKIQRYADKSVCRMLQLVHHFGDENDSGAACGQCDVCAPDAAVASRHRAPTASEMLAAEKILLALSVRDAQTTGQLHRDLFQGDFDRRSFEHILGGLVRAKQLHLTDDSFLKDGVAIPFQRAHLTAKGRSRPLGATGGEDIGFAIADGAADGSSARRPRKPRARRGAATAELAERGPLFEALRGWRLTEAKKNGVPAFRILSDRTIQEIVVAMPDDEAELLSLRGIGPGTIQRYGGRLLEIVSRYRTG